MVLPMRNTIILLAIMATTAPVKAQDLQAEFNAVNELFRGAAVMKLDKHHRLVVDFHDGSGRYRQDVVPVMHLDPENISYSTEEDAVVLGCRTDKAQCIDKEIFKLNTVRHTGRSNLPRPSDDPGGERTMLALRDLLRSAQDQVASVVGETRERPSRIK